MKKLTVVLMLLLATPVMATGVEKSLRKMYCTGFADGVHTAIHGRGPSDKLLVQYAVECEKNPQAFSAYMETQAIARRK